MRSWKQKLKVTETEDELDAEVKPLLEERAKLVKDFKRHVRSPRVSRVLLDEVSHEHREGSPDRRSYESHRLQP